MQLLGFAQQLDDPYKNDDRLYLFMNRARLRLSGHYDRVSFYTEMGLGGEDAVVATTGVSLSLLDFAFNVPLVYSKTTYLKIGQFKVPYGREQLTYEANFQFADRSINNLGFVVGRDVGAAVVSHPGLFTLIGGVFTGGGRDVPPNHYLPEKLGVPLFVARAGIGNFDEDPFDLSQDATSLRSRRSPAERRVLRQRPLHEGHPHRALDGPQRQAGGQVAASRRRLESVHRQAAAQPRDLVAGGRRCRGARCLSRRRPDRPGGVRLRQVLEQLRRRSAVGRPRAGRRELSFVRGRCSVCDAGARQQVRVHDGAAHRLVQPIQEITTSATWFIRGQRLKLLADLPIIIHDPVFTEANVGSYAATDLPDQAAVLATAGVPNGNTVARQNVFEARLMMQAQF